MRLVTHYKPSLLSLKVKHLQAFHGCCQAAHLPYISLTEWPVPHRMEICAHTGQQSCLLQAMWDLLEVRNFMCVHSSSLSDQQHTRAGPSSSQRAQTMSDSTVQQNCTKQKHRAAPWFMQSKTHTHSEVYFDVSQVKTLFLQPAAHRTPAVKRRRDGLLCRPCTEWEQHQALQAFYSGQVAEELLWARLKFSQLNSAK